MATHEDISIGFDWNDVSGHYAHGAISTPLFPSRPICWEWLSHSLKRLDYIAMQKSSETAFPLCDRLQFALRPVYWTPERRTHLRSCFPRKKFKFWEGYCHSCSFARCGQIKKRDIGGTAQSEILKYLWSVEENQFLKTQLQRLFLFPILISFDML